MEKINEFNFWNDHSRNFLEMAYRTDKQEVLYDYAYTGKNTGECGDMVEMYLGVDENNMIETVTYNVEGCLNTNACANTISFLAEGKQIDEAWEITPQTVIDFLETLPPANHHCAELAVGALYKALNSIKADKE
ncbi:iron-sulfur cluster assembly scaffold protein [Thermodesulfobacteriota bacterium]